MITQISTPVCIDSIDPSVFYRWVATESPVIFRLLRNDYSVLLSQNNSGKLNITVDGAFSGLVDDAISVYDFNTSSMYVGKVTNIGGSVVSTDITWIAGMDMRYMNDNTQLGGYYFEGRLTINGVIEPLTVISSPDTFGYADIDVSGLLRIHTSLGKTGDYSQLIMREPTKSGTFTLEYRAGWYGSSEAWIESGDDWYYAEVVRSSEQGSNLKEYVPSSVQDAPFLNMFSKPVMFSGMPFDISLILPETANVSPSSIITVTIKIYNSLNVQIGGDIISYIDAAGLEGSVDSLAVAPTPLGAHHLTAEIELI